MKLSEKRFRIVISVFVVMLVVFAATNIIKFAKKQQADYRQTAQTAYKAWCKFHKTDKISFDEWNAMRYTDSLPGQQKK